MNLRPGLRILLFLVLVLTITATAGCSRESRIKRAVERAEKFQQAGDYKAAEIEYFNVLRLDPQQPVALSRLAALYSRQGRWSLAAPLLVQVIRVVPEDLEARRWAGTLYLASGRTEDARAQAEFIIERQPTNTEAILMLAGTSTAPRQIEELAQRLGRLRQQVGDHPAFHLALANVRFRTGNLQEAETEVQRALELDPQSAVGQIILGQILAAQDRREESESAFRNAFSLLPRDSLRRIQWPVYLLEQGRAEEAYRLLQEVSGQNPGAVWVLIPLSRAALELGRLDEGEQWIKAALELDARNIEAQTLQAQLDLARGNVDGAVESLERLARDHPDSVRMTYQLALGYIASGNAAGAVSTLKRVLELSPQLVPPALMLAELHLRQRDFSSARALLRGLAQRLPEDGRVQSLLAETFSQEGKLDDAAAIYRAALSNNPDDAGSAYRLGQVLLLQGKRAEARTMFEAVVAKAPDYLPAVTYLADLDLGDRDVSSALERLQAEVERHPQSASTRFLLGQTHLANGDAVSAESEFKEVIQLAPDQPFGYLALARLYTSRTNRLADAREQLETLRSKTPGNPQALLMLALLNAEQGDFPAARDLYEELLQSHPGNLLALNNLAYLHATHLGNPGRAIELAAQARKAAPQDPSVADTYGWVLLQQGDHRGALEMLREAAAGLPANAEVLHHLGMAYYMNGTEDQARKNFEDALRLGGDFKQRGEAEACIRLLAVRPGDVEPQTLALLNEALRERPADPVALIRLAAVYENRGDEPKVLELYDRAYQANSNSLPVLLGLARACSAFPEMSTNAMQLARTARKLAPQDPAVSLELGKLAFHSGDFVWALSLLEESATRRPGDPEVLRHLALAYYSVGRLSDSERTIERAAQGLPTAETEPMKGFQEMLALQQNLQDAAEARQLAEQALALEPDNVPARMVLGMADERMGDYNLAGQSYKAVLQAYPEFFPAMKRLAILAADHLGDDKLAYEYGLKAREVLAADPELAGSLGKVLYRRGDYRYAAQLLGEGLADPTDNTEELYYLGLARLRLEMIETGSETLSNALNLDPDHEMAAQAREALGQP